MLEEGGVFGIFDSVDLVIFFVTVNVNFEVSNCFDVIWRGGGGFL